jgi:hypothetical protein
MPRPTSTTSAQDNVGLALKPGAHDYAWRESSTVGELLDDLFPWQGKFGAVAVQYGGALPERAELLDVLGIGSSSLSPRAQRTLAFLDGGEVPSRTQGTWLDLGWRVHAWLEFQDLLEVPVVPADQEVRLSGSTPRETVDRYRKFREQGGRVRSNLHYCYYEATTILVESLVCGLEGLYNAALGLLRPFVELALADVYFRERWLDRQDNYAELYRWIEAPRDKGLAFGGMLKYVIERRPRMELEVGLGIPAPRQGMRLPISELLRRSYAGACAYLHKPKPSESITAMRASNDSGAAFEPLCFWLTVAAGLLHCILCLYAVAYPMSLYPKDIVSRFGFGSRPVGMFFDESNGKVLARALADDGATLRHELESDAEVLHREELYKSQPPLSSQEIEATWQAWCNQQEQFGDRSASAARLVTEQAYRICSVKAIYRVLGWMLNYEVQPVPCP